MKQSRVILVALSIGLAFLLSDVGVSKAQQITVTAIDIALEPDATMLQHARADNDRLLKSFPKGFWTPRRRPVAAFGNSDGDLEMLQWTTMSGGRRLGLIVHHTDAEREYAYDRDTSFGRLDKALDAAAINKWTVVDKKNDWKRIFAFE